MSSSNNPSIRRRGIATAQCSIVETKAASDLPPIKVAIKIEGF